MIDCEASLVTYSLSVRLLGFAEKKSSFQVIVEGTVSKSMSFSKREIQCADYFSDFL